MAKLGKLLVGRGWVSTRAIQSALATQAAGGGRLGTCLLDSNALTEDQLSRALADLHRLPAVGAEDLRGVPDEVIALLPAKLARRVEAVPFRAFGTQVHVVLADPQDLATQDEIVFAIGKRVVFYVAPEVRVAEALERYYGEACSSRVASLLDRLNRTRFLWDRPAEDASGARAEGSAHEAWDEPALSLFTEAPRLPEVPLALRQRPMPPALPRTPPKAPPPVPRILSLSEDERRDLLSTAEALELPEFEPATGPPVAPAPEIPPEILPEMPPEKPPIIAEVAPLASLDEALARLGRAEDAEQVGAVLVGYLSRRFDRVALFKSFREHVEGWLGAGAELDAAALAAYRQGFDEASIFLNLRNGGSFNVGPLARMPAHQRLTAALWGSSGGTWLMLPLRIHGRLVAVIALERHGETPRPEDLEQGLALATTAAAAFERCILRKKRSKGR